VALVDAACSVGVDCARLAAAIGAFPVSADTYLRTKPRLLDLFCGAGGAAVGYHRAGFDVVGVDNRPQPNYPFEFEQADALLWLRGYIETEDPEILDLAYDGGFNAIHASPPCQAYAGLSTKDGRHPDLIAPTRELLHASGLPYVIENIEGAPLENAVRLCGSHFGLKVRRHRLFETSFGLLVQPCWHGSQPEIRGYYGRNYGPALVSKDAIQRKGRKPLFRGTVEQAEDDMGIDWMTEWDEVREAIPPAYTEFIGAQLLAHVQAVTA
jgi:DNA (cytosine-5)-methyltransferase 1